MIGLLSLTFIYSVTTHTIDTELREIFDYARFEKSIHNRVNTIYLPINSVARHSHQCIAELSGWHVLPSLLAPAHLLPCCSVL